MSSPSRESSLRRSSLNLRILLVSLCVGLAFGGLGLLRPLDAAMKVSRNKLRSHDASGEIVVVAIDDRSLAEFGPGPWPRARLAALVDGVRSAGARSIHLDSDLSFPGSPKDDRALRRALAVSTIPITLPARFSIDSISGARQDVVPHATFGRHAEPVNTNMWVRRGNYVWSQPYAAGFRRTTVPSLAAWLGGVAGSEVEKFPIDFAISPRSVPVVSASDVLRARWRPDFVGGRDVVIADTSTTAGHYYAPGYDLVPGVFFHVIAAETLRSGRPVEIGWPLAMLAAASFAAAFLFLRDRVLGRFAACAAFAAFAVGPVLLEQAHIFTEVCPGLALLLTACGARGVMRIKRAFQARGTTNPVSGLPNLNALRQALSDPGDTLVAVRVQNFAEISTALPPECEKELVEQIVSRLSFGTSGSAVYQGDEGLFVWLARKQRIESLVNQLDGLHALFRSPVIVASRLIDLSVTFGLDTDASRPVTQRLPSALVAADTARNEGRRWMAHDPASLEDAEWKLSILGQLDRAIRSGEIWVAYQPKIELATGAIVGAEALARWRHPEKGEIFPSEFIPAAERSGRIENLTIHVLDTAIAAAAAINRRGARFDISVNLSARLLDETTLVPMVAGLLERHGLRPDLLVLEITETSAMAGQEASFANLERLSALGVQLSIDDYGTGFSTLDYLKRIPAAEIKIDRSFVALIERSQSDRIMVHSTIQLAHSLGRRAVAEGVEDEGTMAELRRMRCDLVQGYHTGRPMRLPALHTLLARTGDIVAA